MKKRGFLTIVSALLPVILTLYLYSAIIAQTSASLPVCTKSSSGTECHNAAPPIFSLTTVLGLVYVASMFLCLIIFTVRKALRPKSQILQTIMLCLFAFGASGLICSFLVSFVFEHFYSIPI